MFMTAVNSSNGLRVLVLGGTGFIGRHAVAALHAAGFKVTIGSRNPKRHQNSCAQAAFLEVRFENLLDPNAWAPYLESIDVVVNCVGILRQRPMESYDSIHHRAPSALALACGRAGTRLIHTSALGLHDHAKSRFLSSKLLGERAIASAGCDHCIVRPSLLDGEGGFGASWLRSLSRSPLHLIPRGARGGIAAMRCTDLGEAIAALARLPTLRSHREVELGGSRIFGYAEYLRELGGPGERGVRSEQSAKGNGRRSGKAIQLTLPNWLTRIGAHLCDVLHFSPFSYGHWILLQRDNVPMPNRLPELLGRMPQPIQTHRV